MPHPISRFVYSMVAVSLALAGHAHAQGYSIGWSSLDGGGQIPSTGPTYRVSGTIGQPDAGTLASASYSVQGGFWFRTPPPTNTVDPGEVDRRPSTIAFAGPNPVSRGTAFTFRMGRPGPARLELIDVAGKRLRTLVDGVQAAGRYTVPWNGADASGRRLASGVYFLRLAAEGRTSCCRVALIH